MHNNEESLNTEIGKKIIKLERMNIKKMYKSYEHRKPNRKGQHKLYENNTNIEKEIMITNNNVEHFQAMSMYQKQLEKKRQYQK